MSEPLIMPIRHGSLSPHDKKKLADAAAERDHCACDYVRRGTHGLRPAASAAQASATTRGTATGWPVERLIPAR